MTSAWQKYVDTTLGKERSIVFDEAERETVELVKERLRKMDALIAWTSLGHEEKLNLVRGYWERSHRARDIADTCKDIYDWRQKNNIDKVLSKRLPLHEIYHKAWPSHIAGEDNFGHWFLLDRVTELQVNALTEYDEETVLLYRAQCLEALVRMKKEISYRLGYRVCQYIYCLDLQGLSVKKHFTAKVRSILQPLFRVSGDYYPDSLWNLFLINAPMSFRMIWRVISPWVDPVVKHKIRILGGQSTYMPAMLKTGIPIEALPKEIGGECETITLQQVVEEIIDTPEIADHGFTQYQCKPDPAAVAFHKKQLDQLEKLLADESSSSGSSSLAKRLSKGLSRGLRLKNPDAARAPGDAAGDAALADQLAADGEMIYNGDDVLMQGYLSKQGSRNTAWKKRYFVLTANGLFYFSSLPTKDSHLPRGKIELHMIASARTHTHDSNGDDGLLDVVTPQRVYAMRVDEADGDESVASLTKRWIEAIGSAAENDICAIDVEAVNDRDNENHQFKGFLEKRGVFNSAWRRRYFVLTTHALYYYNDLPTNVGASLKGKVDLVLVQGCDLDAKVDGAFSVTTPSRVFQLKASSKADAEEWLRRISAAVDKEHTKNGDGDDCDSQDGAALNGTVQPPMIRSLPDEEGDETAALGRSSSTIIEQITSLAQEFFDVAMDMGILVKPDDGAEPLPDADTIAELIRKRVMHMFKLF